MQVRLYDSAAGLASEAADTIRARMEALEAEGALRGSLCAREQARLLSPKNDLREAVEGATYVQGRISENIRNCVCTHGITYK